MPGGSWWLFNLLSAAMSALAIVALARHAFVTWSLTAPMVLIMDAYTAVMQLLFGWAHPYIQAALTWLGNVVGWRPTLHPHWRDVLVLTMLWASGFVRATRHDWRLSYSFATILFIAGIIAGAVEYGSIARDAYVSIF